MGGALPGYPRFREPLPLSRLPGSVSVICGRTLTYAAQLWEFDALTREGANPGNGGLNLFEAPVADGNIEALLPDVD